MRVIGVPFNSAGRSDGVARAPRALREAGLIGGPPDQLRDAGDVDVGVPDPGRDSDSGLISPGSLETTIASVRDAVTGSFRDGDRPLLLGGDCPVLLGALSGAARATGDVGLLFVDGHEDAWPPDRSTTGEAADCELGLLLGLHRETLPPSLVRLLPTLTPDAVVALGPRDADELASYGIPSVAGRILMRTGADLAWHPGAAAAYAREGTEHLRRRVGNWWLHIDLDVLATDALPAVDYPQPGGLTWPELEVLTTTALGATGCVGITLCIYNPDLDADGRHARRIADFARLLTS